MDNSENDDLDLALALILGLTREPTRIIRSRGSGGAAYGLIIIWGSDEFAAHHVEIAYSRGRDGKEWSLWVGGHGTWYVFGELASLLGDPETRRSLRLEKGPDDD